MSGEKVSFFDLEKFEQLIVQWTEDASFYRSRALKNFQDLQNLINCDLLDNEMELLADQLCEFIFWSVSRDFKLCRETCK